MVFRKRAREIEKKTEPKRMRAAKWSPLRQEPEAPSNNATSRNCARAYAALRARRE
jgi:hypothetical protein